MNFLMDWANKRKSDFKRIIRSIDLSGSDLYILAVIIGIVLIVASFQSLLWQPSPEKNSRSSLILKQDEPININTASYQVLQELPGIGPVLAGRIVEYRETHGGFSGLKEITAIKGIGPKTYGTLKVKITLGEGEELE